MQVGNRIGPFAIDKELGAGAMGAVYRARHVETGQRVAIKFITPVLAGNSTAMARFQRESAILRQLHHPNIVRLVATGKVKGAPFYAMEYVEGESLDRVMARRGRISWEEVVRLGKQLCAALCHAHQQGIVHRDLKPSNIMVLASETVKLTDFGIAKDLGGTGLTSAHCTVGTAAYMSPEQCRGERDLSHKSDLYSMGVMFYELVTGHKPFIADNAIAMFTLHAQGTFERPSRRVLDIPVWLDTLICQLMEKSPEKRPFDAAAVLAALERIEEKVEAQSSAGMDALTTMVDRPAHRPRLDEDDKEAARELLGKKKKKKKKVAFYKQRWLQGLGFGSLLAVVLVALFMVLLRKPSAAELYQEAEKVLADPKSTLEERRIARKGPVASYLQYYAEEAGEQADQMRAWADEVDRDSLEDLNLARLRDGNNINVDADEKEYRKAIELEEDGRAEEARQTWIKLLKYQRDADAEKKSYALVAARRLEQLKSLVNMEKTFEKVSKSAVESKELTILANDMVRAMKLETTDRTQALREWNELKNNLDRDRDDPVKRPWFLLAAKRYNDLKQQ